MEILGIFEIFLAIVSFLVFICLTKNLFNKKLPTDWPFLGMLPAVIHNMYHGYDYATLIIGESKMTLLFKGPWFSNQDYLITADPTNVRHIMVSQFSNFPKGKEFKEIFDVLGDGIFNTDFELWKDQRKYLQAFLSHGKFYKFFVKTIKSKVENDLVSVLELACEKGLVIDLLDLFQRLTFDSICMLATGYDPQFLSTEFPNNEFAEALDNAQQAILFRHIKPKFLWKLQRWFCIGQEKQMKKAHDIFDRVIAKYVLMKRSSKNHDAEDEDEDLLSSYLKTQNDENKIINCSDDKFLRDSILNFIIAGRDGNSVTLSWFFWLLHTNPEVLTNIRQEIQSKVPKSDGWRLFDIEEVNGLVYLHGVLCETLRLYPPVPFESKASLKKDVLPSGHRVNETTKVLIFTYSMGRLPAIWGDDCLEFKPERWISEQGKVKHEPSHKFMAFNSGPRTCLGKEMAFTQMKLIAAAMIHNYDFEAVKGHHVRPVLSIIIHMKDGFKVKVSKRSWT